MCCADNSLTCGEAGLQLEEGVLSCKACLAFGCEKGDEGVHLLGIVLLNVAQDGAEDNG